MNNKSIKIGFIFLIMGLVLICQNVYAGRGCCSRYKGVDETKCTTDGRQICNELRDGDFVISNGDSCICEPNDYSDENLIDPDGNYETHPYDYGSYDYESDNSNSYNYNNVINNSNKKEKDNRLELKNIVLLIILLFPYIIGIVSFVFEIMRDLITEVIDKIKNKNKVKNDNVKDNKETRIYNNMDKCPYCGGLLVKRLGRYGMFIGCSNYPKCKYTRNINNKKRSQF